MIQVILHNYGINTWTGYLIFGLMISDNPKYYFDKNWKKLIKFFIYLFINNMKCYLRVPFASMGIML